MRREQVPDEGNHCPVIVLRVLSIKIDIVEEALIRRYVAAAVRLRGAAVSAPLV